MYAWIGRLTRGPRLPRVTRAAMILPRPVMFTVVEAAGLIAFALAARTRRRIVANMKQLLPHMSPTGRSRLCARSSSADNAPVIAA